MSKELDFIFSIGGEYQEHYIDMRYVSHIKIFKDKDENTLSVELFSDNGIINIDINYSEDLIRDVLNTWKIARFSEFKEEK